MSFFREYIYSLLIVSASGAVITLLLPDTTKLSRYLHFLVGTVVTLVLLLPLGSSFLELPQIISPDISFDMTQNQAVTYTESILDETCRILKDEITEGLCERFDAEPANVCIYTNEDAANLVIERVDVYYTVKNKLLFSDTVKYIKDIFGSECEVNVSVEEA